MNVYKFESEYSCDGLLYASEIFIPGNQRIEDVLAMRHLPNEELTSDSAMCVHNNEWYPQFELHKEAVEYYIWEKQYVDAIHRLMYLSLIVGVGNVNVSGWFKDNGLMHKLVHMKSRYSEHSVSELVREASEFETTVPGTFLWAMNQIKT